MILNYTLLWMSKWSQRKSCPVPHSFLVHSRQWHPETHLLTMPADSLSPLKPPRTRCFPSLTQFRLTFKALLIPHHFVALSLTITRPPWILSLVSWGPLETPHSSWWLQSALSDMWQWGNCSWITASDAKPTLGTLSWCDWLLIYQSATRWTSVMWSQT